MSSTVDHVEAVHQNVALLGGPGALCLAAGFSGFMSAHYHDPPVVHRTRYRAVLATVALLCLTGVILTVLSIAFYRGSGERERMGEDITTHIHQVKNMEKQPAANEPAVLAIVSSLVLIFGAALGVREFEKSRKWGWHGSTLYAMGWLGNAFAGAMRDKSVESLERKRLAWTLPGATAIIVGTFAAPYEIRHRRIGGLSATMVTTGALAFHVGNALVSRPLEISIDESAAA